MQDPTDTPARPPRQRSARTDPAMRDGDSAHGNPYETAGDEVEYDTDNDVGDTSALEDAIDGTLDGETGQQMVRVDPDRLDRLADQHPGPDVEAADEEEEFTAEAADANLPIDGYEDLAIPAILDRCAGLPPEDVNRVADYERGHRNRKTLLAKLDKLAQG